MTKGNSTKFSLALSLFFVCLRSIVPCYLFLLCFLYILRYSRERERERESESANVRVVYLLFLLRLVLILLLRFSFTHFLQSRQLATLRHTCTLPNVCLFAQTKPYMQTEEKNKQNLSSDRKTARKKKSKSDVCETQLQCNANQNGVGCKAMRKLAER